MSKHTKHHSLHGEVGNFFHLTVKVFRDLERRSRLELHPQIRRERCFMLFCVGYGDFGLR